MSFLDVSGSGFVYVACIISILAIIAIIAVYGRKCYKHALECGFDKKTLFAVMKSSAAIVVVPSLAILASIISLATVVGLPYAWFRLSVMGTILYELLTAQLAMAGLGVTDIASASAEAYGAAIWAMAIPVTVMIVIGIFAVKPLHLGGMKLAAGAGKKWSAVSSSVSMNALLIALMVPHLFKGGVSLATFITSAVLAFILQTVAKKFKIGWLGQFSMAICLIVAMAASVFYTKIF